MKGLLWILVLFAAAVGIALMAHFNEGYVLLVVSSYRVEMSLNLVLFSIVGGFVLFYILLRGTALAISLPERLRKSREQSLHEKRTGLFLNATRLFYERRYDVAMASLEQISGQGNLPATAALLAAQTTLCMKIPDKQAIWLETAIQRDETLAMAAWMLDAQRCLHTGMFSEAVQLLKKIQEHSEHHDQHLVALQMELQAWQGLHEGDEVLRVTRALEGMDGIDPDTASQIKLTAHLENIERKRSVPDALAAYYKSIPTAEESPLVNRAYASALIHQGSGDLAQRFIEGELSGQWDHELVDLYGQIEGGETDLRHLQLEKWRHEYDDDAHLWFAFARIYLQKALPEQAVEALIRTLSIGNLPDARRMLVKLSMETGDFQQAARYFLHASDERIPIPRRNIHTT